MHPDAYTDDAICNAMGLDRFEPVGVDNAIRLLLRPSFHPETCITLEPTRLHVVALRSMLWHEPVPCRLPEYAEVASLSDEQFERAAEVFDRALAENVQKGKCIYIDGMPISALRIEGGRRWTFDGHPVGKEQARFVADLLCLAHVSVSSMHLRNRIEHCGRYVGCTLGTELDEPGPPKLTRVMVLGTPDERGDYFNQLRRWAESRPPT